MDNQITAASTALDKFLKVDLLAETDLDTALIETDNEEILWCLNFSEKLFPTSVVMLCNARHKTMDYITENFTALLGYPCSLFKNISNEDFFALIHPEDVEALTACFLEMVRTTLGYSHLDLIEKRYIIHYRIRHADGHYLYIEDQKLTLESRNRRQVGLTVMRDATQTLNFPGVKLELFTFEKNKFLKLNEYCPGKQNTKITSREAEIIHLLKEGFRSQEIADRLSISVHTVKNHKKNLFKKVNARNSRELLNFTKLPD